MRALVYKGITFNKYEINTNGEVYSLVRKNKRLLSGHVEEEKGYTTLKIQTDEGVQKKVFVHRAVFETFAVPGKYDYSLGIMHKDGNRLNNNINNLAISDRTGMLDGDIREVCRLLQNGHSCKEITEIMGISYNLVYGIFIGKTKSHIIEEFDIINIPSGRTRYTSNTINKACDYMSKGMPTSEILKHSNVSVTTLDNILSGNEWVRVSKDYDLTPYKIMRNSSLDNSRYEGMIRRVCSVIDEGHTDVNVSGLLDYLNASTTIVGAIREGVICRHIAEEYNFLK